MNFHGPVDICGHHGGLKVFFLLGRRIPGHRSCPVAKRLLRGTMQLESGTMVCAIRKRPLRTQKVRRFPDYWWLKVGFHVKRCKILTCEISLPTDRGCEENHDSLATTSFQSPSRVDAAKEVVTDLPSGSQLLSRNMFFWIFWVPGDSFKPPFGGCF